MICRVTLCLNGTRSHSTIVAADTIAALLQALQTVPDGVGVKAIVRVVSPSMHLVKQ